MKLSNKDYLILGMLLDEPNQPGLKMVKESGGLLSRGTIYVQLETLSDNGLVKSEPWIDDPLPTEIPRRLYSLTEKGEAVAKAMANHAT